MVLETSMIVHSASGMSLEGKKQRERASKALSNARQRCSNPKNKDYANYGGQGIKVILESVDDLIACIGLPPPKTSLDRINPHGHYEAGNLRWATKVVQAANKKSSPGGSTPSLQILVAQQQLVVEQQSQRPKTSEAWDLLLWGFNRGKLQEAENDYIKGLLDLEDSPQLIFCSRPAVIGGKEHLVFRLPALTLPNAVVEARGPLRPAPDEELARRYRQHGLLYGLRDIEGKLNLPAAVHSAIDKLLKSETAPGIAFVGQPSAVDLPSGWFEIWMLAAASRLASFDIRTALYPAMTCLELLKGIGSPTYWDEVSHPLLDARLLFIPDFQLDCGPWGAVSPYQFGMLERLLDYRTECGHKTVVGVQAPHKLSPPLQKILLGKFKAQPVANGTSPLSN